MDDAVIAPWWSAAIHKFSYKIFSPKHNII